jgi:hypothetical protein
MRTELQQRNAISIRRRLSVTAAAIAASTILAFTPTKASAFDIGGIIGTAMAMQQMGAFGYHGAPYSHSRGHVASRHDNESDSSSSAGNGGGERDARENGGMDRPSKVATRQSYGSSGSTRQASEHDASAGQSSVGDRVADDEPAYRPSR